MTYADFVVYWTRYGNRALGANGADAKAAGDKVAAEINAAMNGTRSA